MSISICLALFFAMVVLALIPGPGVIFVTARSASAGLRHGIFATLGIVVGDFVFITLALLGLATLASALGELFMVVKYLGAGYLIWLGVSLFRASHNVGDVQYIKAPKYSASFVVGLLTTLGNPKAILFYLSFFPAFLDLSSVAIYDAVLVYIIATLSVGGVMFGYAYMAYKAKSVYSNTAESRLLKMGSGSLLIGGGIYVAVRG